MGNPTTYTDELAEEIVRRLSAGEPLADICRDEHMPATRTVSHWRKAHSKFDEDFLQAREDGFDVIATDCLRIADTPIEGVVEKLEPVAVVNPDQPDGPAKTELQVTERRREDMLGHRKLQVETRMKLLAKWDPRRYGDKLDLNHGGSVAFSLNVRRRFSGDKAE